MTEVSLPSNLEAEQGLLGALLFDNTVYERLSDRLAPEHFFEPLHGLIYSEIEDRAKMGVTADPVTLQAALKDNGAFHVFGGLGYLVNMMDRAPVASVAIDYGRQIIELSRLRDLHRIGGELSATALQSGKDSTTLAEQAEGQIYGLMEEGSTDRGVVSFKQAASGALESIAAAYKRDGKLAGISTGLMDLDQKLGGLHKSDLLILAGRPSMGKEQPIDTPVLTPNGWSTMGQMRVGDYVVGVDGLPVRVVGVYPQGVKPSYRLTFRDLSSVECGEEHLWTVYPSSGRKRKEPQTMPLREIMRKGITRPRGGRIHAKWRVPIAKPIQFAPQEPLPLDPYVLGVLIGDGSISGKDLRFSNHDQDADIRARVAKALPDVDLREGRYDGACPYYEIRGEGRGRVRLALEGMGLRVRSGEKFIPAQYLTASVEDRIALLAGLMDTDGACVGGSSTFYTTSKELASGVTDLIRSLGGLAVPLTYDRTKSGKPVEYHVRVIMNFNPFRTARKAALWTPKSPSRYIHSVEWVRDVEQVCIQVENPDGLYITKDYIVTHNTALATNIAFHVAQHYESEAQPDGSRKTVNGGVVLFFSLEMSAEQLAGRILADLSGVSSDKLRKGTIDAHEFSKVRDATIEFEKAALHIDDTGGISVSKMAARARRQKRLTGLDLIVVDYLQLLTVSGKRNNANRVEQVSEITGALKALAKELNVPVVALSQLSRQLENRDDKRPQLSDLRESGSIEQDADVVMFVYREAYYLERQEPKEGSKDHFEWEEKIMELRNRGDVIIGKQRHGPIGTVQLSFNPDAVKFGNLAREGYYRD